LILHSLVIFGRECRGPGIRVRFAEITSGRSQWQQELEATCTDSSNEATNRRRGEPHGIGA